jgi:hypothetical protein
MRLGAGFPPLNPAFSSRRLHVKFVVNDVTLTRFLADLIRFFTARRNVVVFIVVIGGAVQSPKVSVQVPGTAATLAYCKNTDDRRA